MALDKDGFVLTGADADEFRAEDLWRHVSRPPLVLETSRPGVFAAGDVRRGSIKRMASAVGEGAMAVRLVYEHLFEQSEALSTTGPVRITPTIERRSGRNAPEALNLSAASGQPGTEGELVEWSLGYWADTVSMASFAGA